MTDQPHGHVADGVIDIPPRRLPNSWGNVLGLHNLTPAARAELGWLPAVHEPRGPYQRIDEPVIEPDRIYYPAVDIGIDELAARRRAEMDAARNVEIARGLAYTFDGNDDVIQIRPQDIPNLTAIAARADRRINSGDDTPIPFRAESNLTYQLSPADAQSMTDAAFDHAEQQYLAAWAAKDALDAIVDAHDAGELNIDAARAQLLEVEF